MSRLVDTSLDGDVTLEAHYKLDNGALLVDSSGNGRTLTNISSVSEGTGIWEGAADFSSNNLELKNATSTDLLGIGHGVYSMAGWFNGTGGIFHWTRWDDSNVSDIQLAATSTQIQVRRDGDGGTVSQNSTETIGGWQHIALTLDTTIKVYLDGVEVISLASSNAGRSGGNSNEFEIGRCPNIGSGFSGLIDDVVVFDKVLSHAEVEELALIPPSGPNQNPLFFGGGRGFSVG